MARWEDIPIEQRRQWRKNARQRIVKPRTKAPQKPLITISRLPIDTCQELDTCRQLAFELAALMGQPVTRITKTAMLQSAIRTERLKLTRQIKRLRKGAV